jgi:hypothetical protein
MGSALMMPTATYAGPEDLVRRTIQRRAVDAVIWGMPAVNFELLYQATLQAGSNWNQVIYWSRCLSWKNQTLTPNPDTIYLFPFINTEEMGPMVLEIPPAEGGSITGSLDDAWQTAIEDIGPAGADKGEGGKYLILPPGYQVKSLHGYLPMPSATHASVAFLRSNLQSQSDAHVAQAVDYGKRIKLYPLSQATNPSPTVFVDADDVVYDNTIPYDLRFFEALHSFVQREPWLERDKVMIDHLASIGIEKGRPFKPDSKLGMILDEAASEAHAWLDARYEKAFASTYYSGRHWAVPAQPDVIEGMSTSFARPSSYPVDGRGVTYSFAYFSAKRLGAGQFYLMTIRDEKGQAFDGSHLYRLTVPPRAPAKLYWSATVYDRITHSLIRELPWSSRSSQTLDLQTRDDGSVDLYFGPSPPEQGPSNWVPTGAERQFEILFRFYGPERSLFDRTWQLPDVVRLTNGRG